MIAFPSKSLQSSAIRTPNEPNRQKCIDDGIHFVKSTAVTYYILWLYRFPPVSMTYIFRPAL